MNLSERLTELMVSDDGTEDLTVEQMTTLEACDIPEAVKKRQIRNEELDLRQRIRKR